MYPKETIPNVGRRAQCRGGVDTLTLQGNKVYIAKSTATTPTTFKLLLPTDPGSPRSQSEDVHLYVHMNGQEGSSVSGAPQHHLQHHHPYSRAMKKTFTDQQTHTDSPHPTDPVSPSPSNVQQMTRASRIIANFQHGKRPKNRASRIDQQQTKPRWQGSRAMRRHEKLAAIRPSQPLYKLAKESESHSTLDLSRGCLTGRNPAHYLNDDLEDRRFEMPNTSRSVPADISRLCRDPNKLPEILQIGNTEPLDELLDYYWVYQCMGRQVLNLDLPREIWDRKMFKKCATLPPIPKCQGHTGTDRGTSEERYSTQPQRKTHHAEKTRRGKQCGSETAREVDPGQPQYAGVSNDVVGRGLRATDTEDSKDGGMVVGRPLRGERRVQDRASTMKLVVKMPVLTRDMTCADLPDKD